VDDEIRKVKIRSKFYVAGDIKGNGKGTANNDQKKIKKIVCIH
jgi:hypothetical protein